MRRIIYKNSITGKATLIGNGQVKLNNGQVVTAQYGGYYDAQAYDGTKLLAPGLDFHGNAVSADVIAQTNPNNVQYVNDQRAKQGLAPVPNSAGGNNGAGSGISLPQEPTLDVNALYNSAFNTPEIQAANKAMAAKQAEIEARKKDLADREAQISDDPWLSEAQRVGKINKLRDKANADIQNLVGEYTNLQNNLTSLKSDAQNKVDIGLKQYDINSQAYQQSLQKLNFLISSGALAGASGADLASISSSTGISTGMLSAIVTKAGQTEPYLTTVSDPSGQYVVAIDKNTGSVINKQLIGSGSGSGKAATQQDYADLLKQDARAGKTLSQIFGVYSGYLDPNLIYQLYNSNSRYGAAKESPDQLAKYGVSVSSKNSQQNPYLNP